jgi:cobalt/nickel transport protein
MQTTKPTVQKHGIKWFDSFTKVMLTVMVTLLVVIFISGKYMYAHDMEAGGTDDKVNTMATDVSKSEHHPFTELPGDAQVGAFSVANFFAGLIVGHHWEMLFCKRAPKEESSLEDQAE